MLQVTNTRDSISGHGVMQVDMQAAYTVSRVQLDPGPWPMDFIRGFGLYASTDNATWGTPFVPLVMVSLCKDFIVD